jgi:rhodanese-related sulfurtransferase
MQSGAKPGTDFLIVDVRDGDREENGWIEGSMSMPSHTITPTSMEAFAKQYAGSSILLVFHCQLSQVRGPTARSLFQRVANSVYAGAPRHPRSIILRGGYQSFDMFARYNGLSLLLASK